MRLFRVKSKKKAKILSAYFFCTYDFVGKV